MLVSMLKDKIRMSWDTHRNLNGHGGRNRRQSLFDNWLRISRDAILALKWTCIAL
jgi:hypothetical protein